jgi:hypothetical protein
MGLSAVFPDRLGREPRFRAALETVLGALYGEAPCDILAG